MCINMDQVYSSVDFQVYAAVELSNMSARASHMYVGVEAVLL